MNIIIPIISLGIIAVFLGLSLAFVYKKFQVKVDERVEQVLEILPGMNCGACGFPGCSGYAEAVVKTDTEITLCTPGGEEVVNKISDLLGVEAEISDKMVARVRCQGSYDKSNKLYEYDADLKTCATSVLYFGGDKQCPYSCVGYGDCVKVCPTNAIKIENGVAKINEDKCISCTKCVVECPKKVIAMVSLEKHKVTVLCSSREKGAIAKKACSVACIGCGICAKNCPVDAIVISNDLARIDPDKCIKCNICVEKCPTKAIETRHIKEKKKANIIEEKCIGCTACARVCPVNCIDGEVKKLHTVDKDKCIGCELCKEKCKFDAIEMV